MFPDLYTQLVYEHIRDHDGEFINWKNLMAKYKMSYPTIRKKVQWLIDHHLIRKTRRKYDLLPNLA